MKVKTVVVLAFLSLSFGSVSAQWIQTSLPHNDVRCTAVNGSTIFVGTYGGGVFRSVDDGISWTAINTGLSNTYINAIVLFGSNLFAGTASAPPPGGVFLSSDNGSHWTFTRQGFIISLGVNCSGIGNTAIFAGADGVKSVWTFRSTDVGNTWEAVSQPIGSQLSNAFACEGSFFFAGILYGYPGGYRYGVYRSADNGISWLENNNGLDTMASVLSFAVSGTDLFAGTWGFGVYVTTNNGSNWAAVNSGLSNRYVRSLAASGTRIFAGTRGGVYLSTNRGTSWSSIGLSSLDVSSLSIIDTNLFAGTRGGGLWRRPLREVITSVEQIGEQLLEGFALEQNYPNPFNPTTTIQFTIPVGTYAHTSLRVYDVLGREVATLVNEAKEPGSYKVTFDAADLASGIYFYRLQAGAFIQTRRLLLLR